MSAMGELRLVAATLSRASLIATFAALLICGPTSRVVAADDPPPEELRTAEQRLLGSDEEAARFAACQPFTREIAGEGVVQESFDASLAKAGVPAAARLEARGVLATAINLNREVAAGDRFYVRYEQAFTAEGAPIGVGGVMWLEVFTKARGPVAIHRFRPPGGAERFWLANGEAATAPSMRLPLELRNRLVGLRHAGRSVRPAAAVQIDRQARADGRAGPADGQCERQGIGAQRCHASWHCPGTGAIAGLEGAAARVPHGVHA